MEYNVLDEARHATHNLLQNGWTNHRNQYVTIKAAVDEFNDQIDALEYRLNETKTAQEYQDVQDELTKVIDDILEYNDSLKSSMIVVDDTNPIVNPDEQFMLTDKELDSLLGA